MISQWNLTFSCELPCLFVPLTHEMRLNSFFSFCVKHEHTPCSVTHLPKSVFLVMVVSDLVIVEAFFSEHTSSGSVKSIHIHSNWIGISNITSTNSAYSSAHVHPSLVTLTRVNSVNSSEMKSVSRFKSPFQTLSFSSAPSWDLTEIDWRIVCSTN